MKYDDIIEAIKDSIKYKKLMADAGGGGGGAGAGGGAAGGSGGASAGGSATGTSGDGGSAEGGGSSATPSADSTSSEPTSQRGGYFAGYGGYWASKGSSKKKKKKKAKVGSVKDGIYEGDVLKMFPKKDIDLHNVSFKDVEPVVKKLGLDYNQMLNKPFDTSLYELLLDTWGNNVLGSKDARALRGLTQMYRDRGVKAGKLPPETPKAESINNLQEQPNVDALEDKKYELEGALSRAREITRDIKYVDTHVEIVSKLGTLAEDVGLELDDYNERQVYAAKNKLESAIYELEEVFEDAIRDISNKIDELEYED